MLAKGIDGQWHASVRIHAHELRNLKAYFMDLAVHRSPEHLVAELRRVPFAPFARVRRQMLQILRAVNARRTTAGFDPLPIEALRLRRLPIRPFGPSSLKTSRS